MDYIFFKVLIFGILLYQINGDDHSDDDPDEFDHIEEPEEQTMAFPDFPFPQTPVENFYTKNTHGLILGSIKEIDAFNNLTKEESQKKIGEIVDKMDLNKDGFVTVNELENWVAKSLKHLNAEFKKERFTEVDQNKDGKFEWGEYLQGAFGVTPENLEKMTKDQKEAHNTDLSDIPIEKEKFDLADKNKDGHLDAEEYGLFLFPQGDKAIALLEAKRLFNHVDINNDKSIDLNEYLTDIVNHNEKDTHSKKADFSKNDLDNDGKLNFAEYKAVLTQDSAVLAKKEAQRLINDADTNLDEKLTKEEIVIHYTTFASTTEENDDKPTEDEFAVEQEAEQEGQGEHVDELGFGEHGEEAEDGHDEL